MFSFWVRESTWFKHALPLSIYSKRFHGIKSTINVIKSHKWNDPTRSDNFLSIKKICDEEDIDIRTSDFKSGEIDFFVEGHLREISSSKKKVVITENNSFSIHIRDDKNLPKIYDSYVNEVDNIIFASKSLAEKFNCLSHKNIYQGSPRFDSLFRVKKEQILNTLQIRNTNKNRIALVILPKIKYLSRVDLKTINDTLSRMGFYVITKTRGKDLYTDIKLMGDQHFNDFNTDRSWSPSTTELLLQISDIAINFGSTANIECIAYQVPFIDFKIKDDDFFDFLNHKEICHEIMNGISINQKEFEEEVRRLVQIDKNFYETFSNEKIEIPQYNGICERVLKEILK